MIQKFFEFLSFFANDSRYETLYRKRLLLLSRLIRLLKIIAYFCDYNKFMKCKNTFFFRYHLLVTLCQPLRHIHYIFGHINMNQIE